LSFLAPSIILIAPIHGLVPLGWGINFTEKNDSAASKTRLWRGVVVLDKA